MLVEFVADTEMFSGGPLGAVVQIAEYSKAHCTKL